MSKKRKSNFSWLTTRSIAHRGLFETGTEKEENTLAAVRAAVEAGYAVEVDVRATTDAIIVVYHDETIDRLTNSTGEIANLGFQELRSHMIGNSGAPMPSLPDVLEIVNGQVPLFVEIKSSKNVDMQKLCAGVRHCFEGYGGEVAIMSFDPRILVWFKKYMPKYARGWVIGREALLSWTARIISPFMISKLNPDFIACDINLLPNSFCKRWRKAKKPLLTWTVRTPMQKKVAMEYADCLIFEQPPAKQKL